MTIQLPHVAARSVHEITNEHIILDYGSEQGHDTIHVRDLIAIVRAPRTNGYVEGDQLLLSIEPTSTAGKEPTVQKYALKVNAAKLPSDALQSYHLSGLPDHLHCNKDDLHVIISTLSGAQEAEQFYEVLLSPVLEVLGLHRDQYTLHRTSSERTITELATGTWGPRANEGRPQTIILLSGDGGVVDTVNGVLSTPKTEVYVKPIIGLLALGTGNALANSSALNADSTKGLSLFLQGTPHDVPTFEARFSPGAVQLANEGRDTVALPTDEEGAVVLHGAVVASWGLHASLVADSDTSEYRKFGSDRFSMAARELLAPADGSKPHEYTGSVTLFRINEAGQKYPLHWARVRHMYLLVTFVSNLERALTISPRSRPLDGKLRLLSFGVLGSDEVNGIFAKAFDGGKHTDLESVGYEKIEGIRVVLEETEGRWRRVCIDGKIVMVEEGGWFEVHREKQSGVQLVTVR